MNVQAEVSLYPLRTATLMESIDCFLGHLRHSGLRVEIGPMSSHLVGECGDMFRALGEAFEAAARESDVVVTIKISNACPETDPMTRDAQEARSNLPSEGTRRARSAGPGRGDG